MPGHDIIVIGTSAGGVEALKKIVRGLPPDLPAAVFVVLHIPTSGTSILPTILNGAGPLTAAHAKDGEAIRHGRIYVAPSDNHLLLARGYVHLLRGPKENNFRPAIDPLFRTAARAYGPRVIGVVLTGNLDDGTAGLLNIKSRGGIAVVQDPNEALFPEMPRSAMEYAEVDYCLPLSQIAPLLSSLAREPAEKEEAGPVSGEMEMEQEPLDLNVNAMENENKLGTLSALTCPECSGALWEVHEKELVRFRCHVGHAFSIESMEAKQSEALEGALWAALRSLKEKAALERRMADQARERNHGQIATRYEERSQATERHAEQIQQVLMDNNRNE